MSALPPVEVPGFFEWFKDTYGFEFNGVHHSEQHGFWCQCGAVFGHVKRLAGAHRCAFSEANMSDAARRFGVNLPALPDADTVVGAAWDKDCRKFYDDDTGWSERGYEAGFAAGATWGAEWYAGHMAVCEFLSDLAEIHLLSQPTWHCVRRSLTVHAQGCDCEKRVTP